MNHSASIFNLKMYIFGGSTKGGEKLNDLWIYDITISAWNILNLT
jgi:hypothetical protein